MRKRFLIGAALVAVLGGPAILWVNRRTQSDDFWSDARGQLTERESKDALVDVALWKARKVCYVAAREVDRIELAAGFVWVQFGGHLYRASLKEVQ